MLQAYCPRGRVRFSPATAARLVACPECGESVDRAPGWRPQLVSASSDARIPHAQRPRRSAVSLPGWWPAFVSEDRAQFRR
jgi:hypothetical protein